MNFAATVFNLEGKGACTLIDATIRRPLFMVNADNQQPLQFGEKLLDHLLQFVTLAGIAWQMLAWGFVLSEHEGLALILIPSPDGKRSHALTIAAENIPERVFEDVNLSRFPVEVEDMAGIGSKLYALGEEFTENEVEKWLKAEDLW
jgi:hypothetical protein